MEERREESSNKTITWDGGKVIAPLTPVSFSLRLLPLCHQRHPGFLSLPQVLPAPWLICLLPSQTGSHSWFQQHLGQGSCSSLYGKYCSPLDPGSQQWQGMWLGLAGEEITEASRGVKLQPF